MNKTYAVTGMTCSACSSGIERVVGKMEGVNRVEVSLMAKSMYVDFDETAVTEGQIFEAVRSLGYGIFNEGDVVVVSFDINGREFNDEQTGEIKYFNSVRGYRIERYRTGESAPAQSTDNDPQDSLHEQGDAEGQLPF